MTTHALPLRATERELVLAQPFLDGLFLAAVVTVTFHKLQWELAGSLTLSDVLTSIFLVVFVWDRLERGDARLTRTAVVALGFFVAFALVYLAGFYSLDTSQALAQWAKGMVKFVLHFGFLVTGVALLSRRPLRFYWLALAAFLGGIALNALYGVIQLALAELVGANLDAALIEPITSRQTGINVFGVVGGTQEVFRPNALTGDPNHLGIELVIPLLVLTPLYLRLERGHRLRTPLAALLVFLLVVELATLSRSGLLGLGCGALILALPYRRHLRRPAFLVPLGAVAALVGAVILVRVDFFLTVLRARTNTSSAAASPHFEVYGFVPDVLSTDPVLGLGLNNFAVYYEFVTGRPDFGPHSFYVATLVETGVVGAALFAVFVLWIFRRLGAARRIGRALAATGDPLAARARPLAWGMTAALVATLVANVFYLTMTFYYFYVFAVLAVALPVVFGRGDRKNVKVLVLATSYPRAAEDVAGVFVRDAVEHLRDAGIEVHVVSPASFTHFGLAYGHGIVGNLRRKPWLVLALPLFVFSFARAARRAASGVDLVHAHWLQSALPALATRKPFVLQLWGTDVELAQRAPWAFRWLVRRARLVLCPSTALAAPAKALGARRLRIVPSGVHLPADVGAPVEPPHVLYVGRLSEEKGVRDLLEATEGLARVLVGDGPLRAGIPEAVGFVAPSRLGSYYERAAVVACPSHREGYGVVAREAMAYGRPVVASAVGGLADVVEDAVTGLLVPPRDPAALRVALERLLEDPELRDRLGRTGREKARRELSWEASTQATIAAYEDALGSSR